MAKILIAYTTSEGQTSKITGVLADQLQELGHAVQRVDLGDAPAWLDPATYAAVIVAASVHTGKHQKDALAFVKQHSGALTGRVTAFLSVSMSAASTTETGAQQANEQVASFLHEAGWQPGQVETVAGAFRYSRLSWLVRWATRLAQKLVRKDLSRLGWPEDLTRDREFTDWEALRRFGESFAARLGSH